MINLLIICFRYQNFGTCKAQRIQGKAVEAILTEGGRVGVLPRPDVYVMGNIKNPQLEMDGEIGIVGKVVNVKAIKGGRFTICTSSSPSSESTFVLNDPLLFTSEKGVEADTGKTV